MYNLIQIARHEISTVMRGKSRGLMSVVVVLLGVFCIAMGYISYEQTTQRRHASAQLMRSQFLGQGEVNPHSAAHYGHYVFKPSSALAIIDPGIEKFLGVTLQLEGHQQNDVQFSPTQKASSLVRFGELSFSLLFQIIFPLLILFIAHDCVVREREQGTLKILLAQGVSKRQLVWGKIMGITILAATPLIAATIFFVMLIGLRSPGQQNADMLLRTGLLLVVYCVYYFVLSSFAVMVSARAASAAGALGLVLSVWLVSAVLLPRLAAGVGEQSEALPSKLEFDRQISEANRKGINGHDPRDKRAQRLKDSLLTHYKVDSISLLPVNADGIIMQADEEYHNIVYDKQYANLRNAIQAQNRFTHLLGTFNPALALQQLSMALAGTDIYTHFDFLDQAERYRRFLIKKLNDDMAYGGSKTSDWEWTVKKGYWQKIPDFHYKPLRASEILSSYQLEMSAFVLWLVAMVMLIQWAAPHIRVI